MYGGRICETGRFKARSERVKQLWMGRVFCILASCFLSTMKKNSVLKELRVKRFAVFQEEV